MILFYTQVCVRENVNVCARACVRACACVRVCTCVCDFVLFAFITGNSSLGPLLEDLFPHIHIDLS